MATIRLIPSTYAVSSTNYLSVSNASNMYTNTDSTTYATITNTNNSTSSRYLYLRGFNFDDIPATAIINSFTVKIKGYESGLNTSTSYAPRLANGTSALSNTTATTNFSTSAKTITIPTGALTWQQIQNYGSNFTIMVYVRRSSKNTTGYFYCYGAEIEVNYTVPVYHDVSITNNTAIEVSPSTTQTLLEGDTQVISLFTESTSGLSITDNGTDVTSQLVRQSSGSHSGDFTIGSYIGTNSTVTYSENVGGSDSSTYAEFFIGQQENTYAIWSFDTSGIPANATINSVACEVTAYYNGASSNVTTKDVQLYSGTTPKGGVSELPTSSSDSRTFSLTTGSWTRAELENARIRFDGYYSGTYSQYYFHIYGATLTVGYTINEAYYTYMITNIVADHSIVISSISQSLPLRIKQNGQWITPQKLFVKQNGSWVQSTTIKVKNNGTWK